MRYLEACRVLGISPDASEEEGQSAFRQLAQQHHPDKGGDAKQFRHIAAARQSFLKNRGMYQRHLNYQKKRSQQQKKRVQAAQPYSPEQDAEIDDSANLWICAIFWAGFIKGFLFMESIPLYIGVVLALTLAASLFSRTFRSSITLPFVYLLDILLIILFIGGS